MFKLARYLKRYKLEVILGPLFKLTEAVFELIVPLVMANIIDVGIANADAAYIWSRGGIMLGLGAMGLAFALTCQFFAARASQGFGTEVRKSLFHHINTLSYRELDRFGTPSLITRVTNDVNQAQTAVAMTIRLAFRAPFLIVGAAVMAMLIDLKLSVVFLVTAPLVAAVLLIVMCLSVPQYKTIQKKLDRVSLITRENLEGNRVIRAFSKQEAEKQRFAESTESLKNSSVRVGRLATLMNPLTSVIMNLAIVAIIWFGGFRVDAGDLTQGQIVAFINYLTQILLALVVLANLIVMYTKSAASAARINEVFAAKPSVTDEGKVAVQPVAGAPKIEFRNVTFSFGGGEPAIKNLTLTVAPGETVGIIGGTGSGKSTLVSLVPRFYDVTEGQVLLDGVDVREYPFEQLRSEIGVVPQRAMLFSGTVAENLRWGKKDATDAELRRAAEIAQAADFIDALPDGYASRVEQGGKNFSGGQRQRLTIARALAASPAVLILDDAASALDFATDARLRQALARETAGMAVLMVSQRAGTVMSADKIVVLDEGNVAGIGTHAELLAHCPEYREICASQLPEEAEA